MAALYCFWPVYTHSVRARDVRHFPVDLTIAQVWRQLKKDFVQQGYLERHLDANGEFRG